ncbi:MAG: LysM peptidoglycan-binding domain-containing protein [Planctomycetes bacterium]|nr:LysM peptidoglycan-binding domain-containing protein [Planctomycetota bacterium]
MTSDAKIGLLLGLVFIFIIAFIINGLPNFKSEADNNELTTTMVSLQNKQLGIGSGVADSEVLERPRLLEKVVLLQPPVAGTQAVEQPLVISQRTGVAPATSENQTVRYSTALPGSNNANSNSDLLIGMPEPTKTIEIVAPGQQGGVTRGASSVEENSLRQVSSDIVTKVRRPAVVAAKAKEYIVQDGDSLGSISKKFYGKELGNRKVSIDKIFAANKKTLKSPDAIYVGQKLMIPPVEGAVAVVSKEDKPLGSSMLERVKQIGQRGFSAKKAEPKKVAGVKYVVKEGDNLWKIAHKELGDGSRFVEIAKMNKNVLKNQDNLTVGMTLVLPKE